MPSLDTHRLLRAFTDELARCGVAHACTSPGSRSSPLVLALARERRLRSWSHVDERCAGFFAAGVAQASGMPAVVACTSGTAAANLAPAVIEAYEAALPMVVLTADRPSELRDVGAGQTIDQLGLYGRAAKWFLEAGTHSWSQEREAWFRTLACRAVWTSLDGRPGPVHINFPLREPLVTGGPAQAPESAGGRAGGRPWVTRPRAAASLSPAAAAQVAELAAATERGVIVLGRGAGPGAPDAAARLAAAAGWPVLADPLSGGRQGPAAIAHYDALLRDGAFAAEMYPQLVLRAGALGPSKPLRTWLAALDGALQVALDPYGTWQDPDSVVGTRIGADPAAVMAQAAAQLGEPGRSSWAARWHAADRAAAAAIAQALGGEELSEPRVAAELGVRLPADATLFVASSMPVRDVETFFPARPQAPRVLSNRGANGIDGTISSAFGAAAAGSGRVVLLIGDVALAHDVGGLLAARRLDLPLTIVVIDNGGGGIFDFLPVAQESDVFEEHVATPTGLDIAATAAAFGCGHRRALTPEQLRAGLDLALEAGGVEIIEVPSDRARNVAVHRAVWDAVALSLRSGAAAPPA